ncbi:minor capsid protein [Providencia manganoxydans]
MILEAIASYLQSKNVGKIGHDLFCYYMPPKIPRGYLIMTPNDGIHIDPELKGYYQDMFPLMIRAENVTKVNQLSTSVMAVLDVTDIDTKDVFFITLDLFHIQQFILKMTEVLLRLVL